MVRLILTGMAVNLDAESFCSQLAAAGGMVAVAVRAVERVRFPNRSAR